MDSVASSAASSPEKRFENDDLSKDHFVQLYADGLARQRAIDTDARKPAFAIDAQFQHYLKFVNLDCRNGTTLWKLLRIHWPDAPEDAVPVSRLVVRALRNKRSADSAHEKDKRLRKMDKSIIEALKTENANLRQTMQHQEYVTTLMREAANAGKPKTTSAITGLDAVQLLNCSGVKDSVRPMARTLYEIGSSHIKEVGAIFPTETANPSMIGDTMHGVVYIDKNNATVELPREL